VDRTSGEVQQDDAGVQSVQGSIVEEGHVPERSGRPAAKQSRWILSCPVCGDEGRYLKEIGEYSKMPKYLGCARCGRWTQSVQWKIREVEVLLPT
jgi:hypothetical protein